MTQERFNEIVDKQILKIKDILIKKTAEYNLESDRLSIFKHAAQLEQRTPEQALLGFVAKQITSLYEMVNSNKSYSEVVWDEKITDIICYQILLKGLLIDEDKIQK